MRLPIVRLYIILLFFATVANAKILFERIGTDPFGGSSIYVMDDDRSDVTLLTNTQSHPSQRWSPKIG